MPISYPLPPWVGKPADPAAHYATGFQMGMRLGAEQAANIYRTQQQQREQQIYEQQMARDLQKQEYERQLKEQQIALQVDEVTRKHQAIADYQGLVQQGMDPMQALQQVGPDLGVSPVAAYQASEAAQANKARIAEAQAREAAAQSRFQMHEEGLTERASQASQDKEAERQRKSQASQARLQIQTQQALEKDGVLKGLTDELQTAQGTINRLTSEAPSLIGRSGVAGRTAAVIAGELAREKQNAMELQTKIRQREAELRRRMSVLASAETDNTDQQPAMGPLTMGAGGDQTEMPTTPTATPSRKVRRWNPETGRLEDAPQTSQAPEEE